ncbi:MAG: 30S ribosomal protein S6 [Clostridiales bacterium]|jgi:small subunit ribosomal protein S6|nr:30S ribosomal protein S6 [Clostridiales bacterium]
MHKYEVLYIIRPGLEDEAKNALIERFNAIITQGGGTVDDIEEWGKRKLAYPIDDENEGYYVLEHFTSGTELPRELERNFRISDDVLRYLVTRVGA